jgi:hypothetical protein
LTEVRFCVSCVSSVFSFPLSPLFNSFFFVPIEPQNKTSPVVLKFKEASFLLPCPFFSFSSKMVCSWCGGTVTRYLVENQLLCQACADAFKRKVEYFLPLPLLLLFYYYFSSLSLPLPLPSSSSSSSSSFSFHITNHRKHGPSSGQNRRLTLNRKNTSFITILIMQSENVLD